MKTNKEFLEGIYQKADEVSNEKRIEKKNTIRKITNIAAVLVIALAIGINFNASKTQNNQSFSGEKGNIQPEENILSLKTVGSFENFCSIIKNNNTDDNRNYLENADVATNSYSDASSSKTNIQVENVEEADIVKVEENCIYYISQKKIVIIDAKTADNASKIAEIDYAEEDFAPQEIYVNDNKLIVIGQKYGVYSTIICDTTNNVYSSDKSKTYIIVYDLSIQTQPKEERRIEIEGSYVSSRMIENNIYFATTKNIYNSQIINNDIINLDEANYKPQYKDTAVSQQNKYIEFDSIYCFEQMESTNYLTVGGINLENNEEVDLQTFLGAGSYIYSSEKNMYIAKTKHEFNKNNQYIGGSTHILKFSLNEGKVEFKAESHIEGIINNQFSMDENGEYFRIATTVGDYWNMTENTSNSLYVLNDKLELVGKVSGFAVGEKIYSVRYAKNKAYVVTFKQTDPLFVIDLTYPTNPTILGELKIPGYSTYLHPYDETHIIGFGYDTKEDGTRIMTNGLKMVMFDVTDLNNPKVLFKVAVGNSNTSSELTYNHKALLYDKAKNIIAFPLSTYSRNKNHTKAAIYEINLDKGFTLKGEIEHEYKDYTRRVERIVYVNDAYYTLSKSLIKATDMNTLQVIKEIEI